MRAARKPVSMKLSYKLNRSTNYVFDYLTDMEKFVSAHPVITKMEKQPDGNYLVYETLKLGPIPFSFTYSVAISNSPIENMVTMKATVQRSTEIEMKFLLKADGHFTIVEDDIVISSVWPIRSILQKIFKTQHTKLFNNIESKLVD
jgi:carbon monoxide dehydrogenase subunit G